MPIAVEDQYGSIPTLFPRLRVQHEEVAPVEEGLIGDGGTVSVEPGEHPDDEDALTLVEVVASDDIGQERVGKLDLEDQRQASIPALHVGASPLAFEDWLQRKCALGTTF